MKGAPYHDGALPGRLHVAGLREGDMLVYSPLVGGDLRPSWGRSQLPHQQQARSLIESDEFFGPPGREQLMLGGDLSASDRRATRRNPRRR